MIKITKNTDANGDLAYSFEREDEDGELWGLGDATVRKQDEGTEDEMVWFAGYFDTREISFADEDEMMRTLRKRKGQEEFYIVEN